ncbi:transglutaminase-like cysteine proteinase BTLCP [Maridesulfovibrio ferrireducens]|uniref:Transglutaminase-like cysteine proteinase BTLCP n=1 Tax=Maridesulfovibrio ferrireducens TaxID=246191 RepID=A0A1G9K8U9_9BACT|nr:transglutaminase-like cysteine peptidase [Maridesulfovibrio ferrireducens]SDL45703.1 transglutaminase-like cysteine proteinase BTLCP [Maridesulfovibrio ferrireducens]
MLFFQSIRAVRATVLCVLFVAFFVIGTEESGFAGSKKVVKQKIFGTVEFKGKISKLPKWTRVLAGMKQWKGYFSSKSKASQTSKAGWKLLKKQIASKPEMDRLRAVNKYFNQWPYRLDKQNYGVTDYWATPIEFLSKSGDCEDYAIAKYYALKELGFSKDKMRIVAVRDSIRGIGHAVLVVYLSDDVYVLDNQTVLVLSHAKYKHYVPQYSVNENFRWFHVAPAKKTTYKKPINKK